MAATFDHRGSAACDHRGVDGPLAGDAAILGQALDALACKARDLGLAELAESIDVLGIEAAEIARFAAKLHH